MSIKRLYGSDGHVGGNEWEIFMMENPTEEERWRWFSAMDALFPPSIPGSDTPPGALP